MVWIIKVFNAFSERGVALIQNYNLILTKNKNPKQLLLQFNVSHRKRFSDAGKSTIIKNEIRNNFNIQIIQYFYVMLIFLKSNWVCNEQSISKNLFHNYIYNNYKKKKCLIIFHSIHVNALIVTIFSRFSALYKATILLKYNSLSNVIFNIILYF